MSDKDPARPSVTSSPPSTSAATEQGSGDGNWGHFANMTYVAPALRNRAPSSSSKATPSSGGGTLNSTHQGPPSTTNRSNLAFDKSTKMTTDRTSSHNAAGQGPSTTGLRSSKDLPPLNTTFSGPPQSSAFPAGSASSSMSPSSAGDGAPPRERTRRRGSRSKGGKTLTGSKSTELASPKEEADSTTWR